MAPRGRWSIGGVLTVRAASRQWSCNHWSCNHNKLSQLKCLLITITTGIYARYSRRERPWELVALYGQCERGSSTRPHSASFAMPPPLLLAYCLFILLSTLSVFANSGAGSSLYPPGLQPLINRANALLSAGSFHDAAKAYSEAIGTLDQIDLSSP